MASEEPTILVINDVPEILQLFRDLLGSEGYEVATNRFSMEMGEMLDEARRLQPDLVILDFIIGGEGQGWQFLQMLRMDRATRDIPVIVCTAAVELVRELEAHLNDMGVAVVLKPFDIDRLLGQIRHSLDARRNPEERPTSAGGNSAL